MAPNELFDSAVRAKGDLAGVFEYDGEVGCFYLYKTTAVQGEGVIGAIRVIGAPLDFEENDMSIRWNADDTFVGLFIRGQLWAVFEGTSGKGYGGTYQPGQRAMIPASVTAMF